jgi:hypothetical protein
MKKSQAETAEKSEKETWTPLAEDPVVYCGGKWTAMRAWLQQWRARPPPEPLRPQRKK